MSTLLKDAAYSCHTSMYRLYTHEIIHATITQVTTSKTSIRQTDTIHLCTGAANHKNTCYMLATLSAYAHIPAIRDTARLVFDYTKPEYTVSKLTYRAI